MIDRSGPILLLDSATLYYRAFHALPSSMTAPDGTPHGAVRGFLSTVGSLISRTGASGLIACWDEDWRPAWRVALVPTYKTHRLAEAAVESAGGADGTAVEAEPDDLGPQVDAIAAMLDALGVPRVGVPGYEADDVVASLAASLPGPVIAVSGDRDLLQVASRTTSVLLAVNGGMERWPLLDPAGVHERTGVDPGAYVDMAVLRGDPSDGLPGAPGIGAKTAPVLIDHFGSLDALLEAARATVPERPLTPRIAASLLAHEPALLAARIVATAVRDLDLTEHPALAPDPVTAAALPHVPRDAAALAALAEEWGVTRFLPRW